MPWESVIGLEVHVQLRTDSKIFSGASTAFGAKPNVQACEVDIALPGVLPVMNRTAALMAVRFGLATGATVNRISEFARKSYFYPGLPKGYQISQYDLPFCQGGHLDVDVEQVQGAAGVARGQGVEEGRDDRDGLAHAASLGRGLAWEDSSAGR